MPSADPRFLAFSLARVSHHDWCRADQAARRLLLARSNLPLLSLRNAADPQSDQSLSAFFTALVAQVGDGLEPLRRTRRAMVFLRSTDGAAHRRSTAGHISNLSHHQRESFLSELSDDHSFPRLLRRHVPSTPFAEGAGSTGEAGRARIQTVSNWHGDHRRAVDSGCVSEHCTGAQSRFRAATDELLL